MEQNNKEFIVGDYVGMNYKDVVRMLENNNIRVNLVESIMIMFQKGRFFIRIEGRRNLIPVNLVK